MKTTAFTRPLAALVLLLAAAVAWLHFTDDAAEATSRAAQVTAAQKAATDAIPFVLSYRHTDLAAYEKGVERRTSGKFRDEFDELVPQLTKRAEAKQLVIQAELSALSEIKAAGGKVTLLAFVNQSTTAKGTATPTVQGVRLEVVMEEQDGAWVLTAMTPV